MGRPKESLPAGGDTLLGATCTTLLACCSPVVVVARDANQVLPPLPAGVARTHDQIADRGPLAGLAAGLQWLLAAGGLAPADAAFVVACDHPFLTAAAVRWLHARLEAHDAVVPRTDGALQPLCAIYRLALAAAIERLLAAGEASPKNLLAGLAPRVVEAAELRTFDPELRFLRNVNTPADWESARRG